MSAETPLLSTDAPLKKRTVIGWIAFSLTWNISNSILYATLFPKLLKKVSDDPSTLYSAASTLTTILASILLPALGILADKSASIKKYLIKSGTSSGFLL
ncbi:hypothetical protein RCL1_004629 [Eukaryota sp. TZLM3-RCL]